MRLPLLAAALLLAGCASPAAPLVDPAALAPTAGALDAVRALMADVPCEAEVDAGTSANLLHLADLAIDVPGAEMDIRDDGIALLTTDLGLAVLDLRDPLDMKLLAHLELPDFQLDARWSGSGDAAFVGGVGPGHVHLIDMADPAVPKLMSTLEVAGQGHSLSSAVVDGVEYLYVSAQTAPHGTHVVRREGWELVHLGQYRTLDLLSTPVGHHDNTVVVDPLLDNGTYLYVAQGFEGWSVADLADPTAPVKVGGPLLPELGPGYTHMLRVAFVDGKRIVVSMQEVGLNTLNVYDATDLANPTLIARWNADPVERHLPQHNIQVVGDHLFMAHYELGFFAFNLTDIVAKGSLPANLGLAPVAHYAVEKDAPGFGPEAALRFSDVVDLQVLDGVIYINDFEDGVSSVGFGCLAPGSPELDALV